jgi:hypothetical protein
MSSFKELKALLEAKGGLPESIPECNDFNELRQFMNGLLRRREGTGRKCTGHIDGLVAVSAKKSYSDYSDFSSNIKPFEKYETINVPKCHCESRTVTCSCLYYDYCTCYSQYTCSCLSQGGHACECDTFLECECFNRTNGSCVKYTYLGKCTCKTRTYGAGGCTDKQVHHCYCVDRTSRCSEHIVCDCQNRAAGCNCNSVEVFS